MIQSHLTPCPCTTENLFSRRRCYPRGKISIWHTLSACCVTTITIIRMIVTLPLLPATVFPVKRRNRHSLVGPQQGGGRPAPVRRSNTMPPNLGNAGLLGRMLDEKAPPSPSGTFLSLGRLGQPVGPCDPALIPAFPHKGYQRSREWCAWCVDTTTGSPWPIPSFLSAIGAQGGWWEDTLSPVDGEGSG